MDTFHNNSTSLENLSRLKDTKKGYRKEYSDSKKYGYDELVIHESFLVVPLLARGAAYRKKEDENGRLAFSNQERIDTKDLLGVSLEISSEIFIQYPM